MTTTQTEMALKVLTAPTVRAANYALMALLETRPNLDDLLDTYKAWLGILKAPRLVSNCETMVATLTGIR